MTSSAGLREAALSAVGHLIDELKNKYHDHERITATLKTLRKTYLHTLRILRRRRNKPALMRMPKTEPTFTR